MKKEKRIIRRWLIFFMVALFLSGLTALPVERELSFLLDHFPFEGNTKSWLEEVLIGVRHVSREYPFMFYGYDWLAFAHFLLALLLIGPLRDPVKNKWVIEFGLIACLLVVPFALVAGHFRGMPFWWRLVDCSFGIIGWLPLMIVYKKIGQMEKLQTQPEMYED